MRLKTNVQKQVKLASPISHRNTPATLGVTVTVGRTGNPDKNTPI